MKRPRINYQNGLREGYSLLEWACLGVVIGCVLTLLVLLQTGCTVAPKPTQSQSIDFDVQTGLQDGGLIGEPYVIDGVVWWHTSDDFRADYIRLLGKYGDQLTAPPSSPDEGWNLTPPIACNPGVRFTMKQLRALDRSAQTLSPAATAK